MASQDVLFAAAVCRVDITPVWRDTGGRMFVARMSIIDEANDTLRPLVDLYGWRAEVQADTEMRALDLAVGFLERHLGRQTGITYFRRKTEKLAAGDPITVLD